MKLGPKFILAFLAIGLLPFAAITTLTLSKASSALEMEAFDKLKAVRAIKKTQTENYFKALQAQLFVLQNDPTAFTAFENFEASFASESSTSITEAWKKLAEEYDPYFHHINKTNGWYDLFLIGPKGKILYSAARESDLGKFVTHPDIVGSGLQTNLDLLRQNPALNVAVSDFKPYTPSKGDPAAFMTTRIRDTKGNFHGYMALQVPLERINAIMQERSGMGETGETYLVGQDKLMRSDSFLDPTNHSVIASFKNPKLGSVDTEGARAALKGEESAKIIIDYNGNPVLSAYTRITVGDIHWALLSEIDESEAFGAVNSLRNTSLVIAAICILLILGAAILLTKSITNPIHKLVAYILELAQGRLDTHLEIHSKDEIGDVALALEKLSDDLNKSLTQVMQDSTVLANSSTELSAISSQLANAATEMNSQTTTVAGATDQMNANIAGMATSTEEMSANTQTISATATEMNQNMQISKGGVESLAKSIEEVASQAQNAQKISNEAQEKSQQTTRAMNELNASAIEIGEVTALIKEIAQQTNLLALNANIEAASAGEAGKGFAVVANEIKELANQSQKAAEDIAKKITDVQQSTENSVHNIEQMAGIIDQLNQSSNTITASTGSQSKTAVEITQSINESAVGVEEVSRLIEEMANTARTVASSATELSAGSNEIAANIANVSKATNETASGANQIQSESQNLAKIANALQQVVQQFKLRS